MSSAHDLYLSYPSSNPNYTGYQHLSSPSDSSTYSSPADLTSANSVHSSDYGVVIPQHNSSLPPPYIPTDRFVRSDNKERHHGPSTSRLKIAHPYARLFAKTGEVKRRKIWNHALEKSLFSPYELYVDSYRSSQACSRRIDRRLELLIVAQSTCQAWKLILTGCTLNC